MPDDLGVYREGDLVFNGINAITGEYGQPPLSSETLARLIRGEPLADDYRRFVERQKRLAALAHVDERLQRVTDEEAELRAQVEAERLGELRFKVQTPSPWPTSPGAGDPADVANAGWGVIFAADMNAIVREEIKEALQPLLDLRQSQAGDLFRIYEGGDAYRSGERKSHFFERLGVGPGLADPREMPFYLLLIGTPEDIPYSFQYQLDVMRAVGRLDFGSDIEAYQDYALSVVLTESGDIVLPRKAAFFAPANQGDKATQLSSQLLVQPLYENLAVAAPEYDVPLEVEWDLMPPFIGEGAATHEQLQRLLGGDPTLTPALLFTASHGIELPANHPAQTRQQGALLCQDWPGPGSDVLRNHYFAAEDVHPSADLTGMMAFFFACYGAGTPQLDQFAAQAFKVREKIAPHSFTAALPQHLLKQGALAVVGHVERAWGYSFISPQGREENRSFITLMRTLMNGDPIGMATDLSFNMRYAELSSDLSADLEELNWNPNYMSNYELAHRWTANNDARSYVVIGDPATRLPVTEPELEPAATSDLGVIGVADEVVEFPASMPTEEPAKQLPEEPAGETPPWTDEGPTDVTVTEEPPAPTSLLTEEESWAAATPPPLATEVAAPPEPPAKAVTPPPLPLEAEELEIGRPAVSEVTRPRVGVPKPAPLTGEAAVGFGLKDEFEKLRASLKDFTNQLARSLGNAASDIVTLEVKTYSTPDIDAVAEALADHTEVSATLRALTRVAFDGDLQVYVPEKLDQGTDPTLWTIHKSMVEEAQDSRANFLATMADLAAKLLDSLRIG